MKRLEVVGLIIAVIAAIFGFMALLSRGTLCNWGRSVFQTDIFCEPASPSSTSTESPLDQSSQSSLQSCETTISDGNILSIWKPINGKWGIADDADNKTLTLLSTVGAIECGDDSWIDYEVHFRIKPLRIYSASRVIVHFRGTTDSRFITTFDLADDEARFFKKVKSRDEVTEIGVPVSFDFVPSRWTSLSIRTEENYLNVSIDNAQVRRLVIDPEISYGSVRLTIYGLDILIDDLQVNLTLQQQ